GGVGPGGLGQRSVAGHCPGQLLLQPVLLFLQSLAPLPIAGDVLGRGAPKQQVGQPLPRLLEAAVQLPGLGDVADQGGLVAELGWPAGSAFLRSARASSCSALAWPGCPSWWWATARLSRLWATAGWPAGRAFFCRARASACSSLARPGWPRSR